MEEPIMWPILITAMGLVGIVIAAVDFSQPTPPLYVVSRCSLGYTPFVRVDGIFRIHYEPIGEPVKYFQQAWEKIEEYDYG